MMATRANAKKRKDALGTTSCKANLYDDDGDGTWDRAKLDVDRDGTWDEAWSRKHGRLERKLSATRQVLIWNGSAWQPKTK